MEVIRPFIHLLIAVLAIMVMIVLVKLAVNRLPDGGATGAIKDVANAV